MRDLDDASSYEVDAAGMFSHIERLGDELMRAWTDSSGIRLPSGTFDRLIFAGMGGSAAAGDYVAGLAYRKSPFPVELVRGYDLPTSAGPGTLVVTVSYSGNTEEALACYGQAGGAGCGRYAVSNGGELEERAANDGVGWHRIGYASAPRAALPHSLAALLRIADRMGAISLCDPDMYAVAGAHKELVTRYIGRHVAEGSNPAKQLAALLVEAPGLAVFAAEHLAAPGRRTKNQIAENSKRLAVFEEVPEATHNVLVGLDQRSEAPIAAIAFDAPSYHAANRRRIEVLSGMLEEAGVALVPLRMRGISRLADMVEATAWGDYLSCYMAVLAGVDPTPTLALSRMRDSVSRGPVQPV